MQEGLSKTDFNIIFAYKDIIYTNFDALYQHYLILFLHQVQASAAR
jgi:hypothetical protein